MIGPGGAWWNERFFLSMGGVFDMIDLAWRFDFLRVFSFFSVAC
jgi:hypothetical protein